MIRQHKIKGRAMPLSIVAGLFGLCNLSQGVPSDSSVAPMFDVFDQLSGSPAGSQGSSTLNMIDEGDNWAMGTEWTPQTTYDETDVFHVELQHRSADQDWNIRIGKGGQLYSWNLLDGTGELIPPQGHHDGGSPWVDDVILQTWRDTENFDADAKLDGISLGFANTFVHGAGMYIHDEMDPLNDKPFYAPMLAENFSSSTRSYACINWGVTPTPSINRSDIVLYNKYRHLGDGVLEITYYGYNYGENTYSDNTFPWAMVRLSEFPNCYRGLSSGSGYERWLDGEEAYPVRFNLADQGGWVAKADVAQTSLAISTVHGTDDHYGESWQSRKSWCSSGISGVPNSTRDISIMTAANNSIEVGPGQGFFKRFYMVLGQKSSVFSKSYSLVDNVDYGFVDFNESSTDLMPLYSTTLNGQSVLTSTKPSSSSTPVLSTYALPVKNSVPLFLLRNTNNGYYYMSTDPYALCGKWDIDLDGYSGRHVYQPYDDKTEWVALLGYVMPSASATVTANTATLSSTIGSTYRFATGEKYGSGSLLIRTDGSSDGGSTITEEYEAEDGTIISASVKTDSAASGGEYVDGNANFNLTFNVNASAGTADLRFRIKSPSGSRSMGVYVNGAKVGTVTTSLTYWNYKPASATLVSGNNTIELRDSEGTNELDVDLLEVTTSVGSVVVTMQKRNASTYAMDGNWDGADGQNVYLYSFSGNINQQWEEIDRGDGYYSYQKSGTTFSLDGGSGGANGQTVYLWSTNPNNYNQHWRKVDMGSGYYRLEKRNSTGFSIDGGNDGANGQDVYLWTSKDSNQNQHWLVK